MLSMSHHVKHAHIAYRMARGRGNRNNDLGPTTGPTTRRGATAAKVAAKAAPKGASKKTASKKSKDMPKNKKIAAPTVPLRGDR
jgi:hypothetical protein